MASRVRRQANPCDSATLARRGNGREHGLLKQPRERMVLAEENG